MKSYFCSTASPTVSRWTRGEGTAWAEVRGPALSSSLALLCAPGPAAPSLYSPSLPAQTHSPQQDAPTEQADARCTGPRLQQVHCGSGKPCVDLNHKPTHSLLWVGDVSQASWACGSLPDGCLGAPNPARHQDELERAQHFCVTCRLLLCHLSFLPAEGAARPTAVERDGKQHEAQRRERPAPAFRRVSTAL